MLCSRILLELTRLIKVNVQGIGHLHNMEAHFMVKSIANAPRLTDFQLHKALAGWGESTPYADAIAATRWRG